ncbi:MAG: hypothetical protein RBT63_05175, partial [Bdellovibrionales bacterium]|nr:hypothetical protein [Bdellovibrionales bacterium]
MKFLFESQPFAGNNPRPTPEVFIDPAINTLIIAIPWGSRESARRVIDRMSEYLTFASQDHEATSPLPKLSCLSSSANNLRTAAMLANDMIYREDNQEEYKSGVELFAATLSQNELSWVQIGGPHILLARGSSSLLPLGSNVDLSLDLTSDQATEPLPALPAQLLGLDPHVNLMINSFRARSGDRLVLLSHSRTPDNLFSLKSNDIELRSLVKT